MVTSLYAPKLKSSLKSHHNKHLTFITINASLNIPKQARDTNNIQTLPNSLPS